jgi:hypothetical protein
LNDWRRKGLSSMTAISGQAATSGIARSCSLIASIDILISKP